MNELDSEKLASATLQPAFQNELSKSLGFNAGFVGINMNRENCEQEASIAQLSHLNNRVNVYATKLWHMPFAYLAIVCVAISQFGNIKGDYIYVIGLILVLSGCAILIIILNHLKRIDQLILMVHNIETSLNLENSMVRQKVLPYYFLVIICITFVIAAGWLKWSLRSY